MVLLEIGTQNTTPIDLISTISAAHVCIKDNGGSPKQFAAQISFKLASKKDEQTTYFDEASSLEALVSEIVN